MQDFDLALTAAVRLARQFRVVDDEDLRAEFPGIPRPVRHRAFDRLSNERSLHSRKGRAGYDSNIYDGCVAEHRSGASVD